MKMPPPRAAPNAVLIYSPEGIEYDIFKWFNVVLAYVKESTFT